MVRDVLIRPGFEEQFNRLGVGILTGVPQRRMVLKRFGKVDNTQTYIFIDVIDDFIEFALLSSLFQ